MRKEDIADPEDRESFTELCPGLCYWLQRIDNFYATLFVEGDGKMVERHVRWQNGPDYLKLQVREMAAEVGFRPTNWPD